MLGDCKHCFRLKPPGAQCAAVGATAHESFVTPVRYEIPSDLAMIWLRHQPDVFVPRSLAHATLQFALRLASTVVSADICRKILSDRLILRQIHGPCRGTAVAVCTGGAGRRKAQSRLRMANTPPFELTGWTSNKKGTDWHPFRFQANHLRATGPIRRFSCDAGPTDRPKRQAVTDLLPEAELR